MRINRGIHKLVKIRAAEAGKTMKSLVEGYIVDGLGPINIGRKK